MDSLISVNIYDLHLSRNQKKILDNKRNNTGAITSILIDLLHTIREFKKKP